MNHDIYMETFLSFFICNSQANFLWLKIPIVVKELHPKIITFYRWQFMQLSHLYVIMIMIFFFYYCSDTPKGLFHLLLETYLYFQFLVKTNGATA